MSSWVFAIMAVMVFGGVDPTIGRLPRCEAAVNALFLLAFTAHSDVFWFSYVQGAGSNRANQSKVRAKHLIKGTKMANAKSMIEIKAIGIGALAAAVMLATPAEARGIFDKIKTIFGSDSDTSGSVVDAAKGVLSNDDMVAGLKDALRVGAGNVVSQLGAADGFWKDEAIRIALPGPLQKVDKTLSRFGMGALTDGVKEKMNRAAEAAVPEAKELFMAAVSDMSITDAANILRGPDDAATTYFKEKMGPQLRERMTPIVSNSINDVGVISAAEGAVKKLPFGEKIPDLEQEMTSHVLDGAVDGVFYYLAKEEAAIRANPAKRTTDILKKVFK